MRIFRNHLYLKRKTAVHFKTNRKKALLDECTPSKWTNIRAPIWTQHLSTIVPHNNNMSVDLIPHITLLQYPPHLFSSLLKVNMLVYNSYCAYFDVTSTSILPLWLYLPFATNTNSQVKARLSTTHIRCQDLESPNDSLARYSPKLSFLATIALLPPLLDASHVKSYRRSTTATSTPFNQAFPLTDGCPNTNSCSHPTYTNATDAHKVYKIPSFRTQISTFQTI